MDELIQVFDVSLLVTVGLIFAVTLLGAYLRSRRRDICLKSFEGFHVTLERSTGKVIWGVLELESSGLELRYRDSVQDANHVESSYLLYMDEFADLQAIYRYVEELSDEAKAQRLRDLRRSFHPGIATRTIRSVQHFFSLASDSLSDVFGLLMGRLRKPAGRYITEAGEVHLKQFGTTVIGQVGRKYDPLLERLVGQKVVFDLAEADEIHEHVGIFKNYSPDFIEILDVQFPQRQALPLQDQCGIEAKTFTATVSNGSITVLNRISQPLLIQSLSLGDHEELLNVVVDGNESVEFHPEQPFKEAELHVRVVRELDMIVPRSRCLVRHRAERYEPDLLPEIIFDLGVILTGSSVSDAREDRLRRQLEKNPYSALAASNLGAILVQKQQFEEAEKWLDRAYEMRFSLPDNGKRTQMLRHELTRKRTKSAENSAQMLATSETVLKITEFDKSTSNAIT